MTINVTKYINKAGLYKIGLTAFIAIVHEYPNNEFHFVGQVRFNDGGGSFHANVSDHPCMNDFRQYMTTDGIKTEAEIHKAPHYFERLSRMVDETDIHPNEWVFIDIDYSGEVPTSTK